MKALTITASEAQIRAGARVLRGVLHTSSLAVTNVVAESLADSSARDVFLLVDKLEAALLLVPPPEPATPVLDARD